MQSKWNDMDPHGSTFKCKSPSQVCWLVCDYEDYESVPSHLLMQIESNSLLMSLNVQERSPHLRKNLYIPPAPLRLNSNLEGRQRDNAVREYTGSKQCSGKEPEAKHPCTCKAPSIPLQSHDLGPL